MRTLLISENGDGLGIAHQLVKEGHIVDCWIKEAQFEKAGVGIVNRIDSWRPAIPKADLILVDMVGFGTQVERVATQFGKPYIGCDPLMDVAELDRQKGMELFLKAGIKIPETFSFQSPAEALSLLKMWKEPGFVIKPCGNISTAETTVCRDQETFQFCLEQLDSSQELIVQRIVEGVEISTEGWWNGRGWITPFNHTFEEKRFLEGNLGPNTGCMGNIVIAAKRSNKLIQNSVMKLETFLKKTKYKGPVDVICIVTEKEAYSLEITARFGYDAIEALMEGLNEPVANLLFDTATGTKKAMDVTMDFMAAVRLSVPPWPHAKPAQDVKGKPILGLNEQNMKHIYLTDAYKEGKDYFWAGGDGVVLKATARGVSVREATRRVYRTLTNVNVLDKQYRLDIGDRVERDLGQL